ncbi:MAG TPA: hypothetical protein VGM86_14410 [Thermoanaerobaculia bacterium]
MRPADLARVLARLHGGTSGTEEKPGLLSWLRGVVRRLQSAHWGLPQGVDAQDPAQAGWAVVFHESEPAAVRDALAPLVAHRERTLGHGKVKVLEYRSGEEWRSWLARHHAEPGSVLPHRVPYYVLLAGGPERIPFDFQSLLSVEYAAGRLSFDSPDEYRQYADSVIEYETGAKAPNGREAVFFGTRHDQDPATEMSADDLVRPLAEGIPADGDEPAQPEVAAQRGFATRTLLAADATRANLAEVFSPPAGTPPPALLFSATHGLGLPNGHPEQRAKQGALVCQDSLRPGGAVQGFSGDDLAADARVHGMVCFHFACFGAGTPERDDFLHEPGKPPPALAPGPFVARLPQRLLAHPGGGALAVLGHVERAWSYSIQGASGRAQLLPFQNTLGAILEGWPVGHAVRDFRQRFAMLSAALGDLLERAGYGLPIPEGELETLWVERNDARNYAVLGDPAARLRVDALAREVPA